jgi:hypothetical protein
VHDLLLGRFNMANYLRQELLLQGDNHLFDKWPLGIVNDYAQQKNGTRFPTPITAVTPRSGLGYAVIEQSALER